MFKYNPAVFTVGKNYQIMVADSERCVMWVRINGKNYYDASNGVLRSDTLVHRMTVPKSELDSAQSYTVCKRNVLWRKAYFSETSDIIEESFEFRTPKDKNIRAFHIADTHDHSEPAIKAAKTFGDFDLLILNGDIPENNGEEEKFFNIYKITSALTGGRIPVVYSRGNHENRGTYAEHLERYTPVEDGHSYFTFRIGDVWGMVLDCGEDKNDDHIEYGNVMCCFDFRRAETEYIKKVIANSEDEYAAEGVRHRIIISHTPFTWRNSDPEFDIENDVFSEWTALLRENIKPEVIICGHKHKLQIYEKGSAEDAYGQPCPVVLASAIEDPHNGYSDGVHFTGGGITFDDSGINFEFIDNFGKTVGKYDILL